MSYKAPVRDMMFVLESVAELPQLAATETYGHADAEMVECLLGEAGRFFSEVVAPTNVEGDTHGSVAKDGEVVTPPSFKSAYDQFVAAGWGALQFPEEFGGGGFPLAVGTAVKEMITSANMAFSLAPLLTTGAVVDLLEHGDDQLQQTYLPKMVAGEWTATMNLSEPQAGSDVGALTTKAVPAEDGTYLVKGTKIWITWGDHDLTDNICHLVLARLPDAPEGTRGISLFLVPKYVVNQDGSLGERNAVTVVSTEEKLGIHASPTCVMEFDDAVGYLIGEPNKGMRQMFTMMNDARLGVGMQGLAISERAYQNAVTYALERRQGKAIGDQDLENNQSLIVHHPDVRRMLMTIRASNEAMRCLVYRNAAAIDLSHAAGDAEVRAAEQKMADLLTPLTKAWCTDVGVELTSIALQVFGGMGYVEEAGASQHLRDARIAPIYEGTNGIQALDLVGRKLPIDEGAFVKSVVDEMRALAAELDDDVYGGAGEQLTRAIDTLQQGLDYVYSNYGNLNDVFGGASPLLRIFATTMAGYLLCKSAVAAKARIDAGDDDAFYADKLATTRFYVRNILPTVHGLLDAATAGAEDLFAIQPQRLSV